MCQPEMGRYAVWDNVRELVYDYIQQHVKQPARNQYAILMFIREDETDLHHNT